MPANNTMTRPLLWTVAGVVMLIGLGLVAYGLFPRNGPTRTPGPPAAGTGVSMSPLPRSVPQQIKIPIIGVDAPIRPEGLDAVGRLEAPPLGEPNLTGWYRGGPSPGQLGPAVIEGHVDSRTGPSVFYRLNRLTRDARIEVLRQDGTHVVFAVDAIQQVRKDAFPTEKVYGTLDYAALRLITCGGAFDRAKGSYKDNIIVYAHRVGG